MAIKWGLNPTLTYKIESEKHHCTHRAPTSDMGTLAMVFSNPHNSMVMGAQTNPGSSFCCSHSLTPQENVTPG